MLVLYAEDDLDDAGTFCEQLSAVDSSIKCIHVNNGIEAIDFLNETIVLPDYIFLDINMPLMDGRTCLKEIRKDGRFQEIPVVVYTTSTNPNEKALCLELGAHGFLQKPTSQMEGQASLAKIFGFGHG